jgi:drug/metabolite transporter (DMT)-like permease
LLCFIWGFSWVAIKISLEGIPPFLGAGLRFLIAVPLLYSYLRLRRISIKVPRRVYSLVAITAILIYGVDYGLVYWSEQYISAGVTAILFATFPFFTGIFSHFVVKSETLGTNIYVGLFLGFLGVLATFYEELFAASPEGRVFWATLAVIISAMAGALATVLTKKHLTSLNTGSLALNQTVLGGILLLLIALIRSEFGEATWSPVSLFGLAYLGAVASALAFTLFYWLLQRMSAVTLASMIYILPIVAVICEWVIYGEVITLNAVIGMVLIFVGIAIAELPKYRSQVARSSGNVG